MKVALDAGIPNPIVRRGDYILLADSVEPVEIFIEYMDGSTETLKFYVQRGYSAPTEFKQLLIKSEVNQLIEIEIMRGKVEDSRVSGDLKTQAKAGEFSGLPVIDFDVNLKSIAGNANRKELILRAAGDNVGQIFIGGTALNEGIPLDINEPFTLETSADLSLYATNINDRLFVGETVY